MTLNGPCSCDPVKSLFPSSSSVMLRSSVSPCRSGRARWPHLGQATRGGLTHRPISDLANSPTTLSLPFPRLLSHLLAPALPGLIGPQPPSLQEKQRRGPKFPESPFTPPPTIPSTAVSPYLSRPRITRLPGAQEEVDHILEGLCQAHCFPLPSAEPPAPTSSPDLLPHAPLPRELSRHGANQAWAQILSLL